MPIYYEAKALERAIDTAPRITPSTKSVLKKIIRSAPVADSNRWYMAAGFRSTVRPRGIFGTALLAKLDLLHG